MAAPTSDQINKFNTMFSILKNQRSRAELYSGSMQNAPQALQGLRNHLNQLNKSEETYNQEYLDRKKIVVPPTFFEKIGIRTLQDWVLLGFFTSYGILALVFSLYITRFAGENRLPVLGVVGVLAIVLGLIIAMIIIRMA
jgi:membrane-bound ClpP family serine protease